MSEHRLVNFSSIELIPAGPPFSNFDFVDNEFGSVPAIRRLFSQARSYGCQTVVVESIPATGVIAEDDAELSSLFPDFKPAGLQRLSFWKTPLKSEKELLHSKSRSFLGFAILKRDNVPSRKINDWYVFESVIVKYPHEHNCVRSAAEFHVRLGENNFSVTGFLYCQQNALNKACAQVALRALLGTLHADQDLSYRQINAWASTNEPWMGLNVSQIQRVLKGAGIGFYDIDYCSRTKDERCNLPPYQKLLYAGIESGAGALLGFRLSGKGLTDETRHIVPFFGHTFNQDAWVPHAELAYFHVGETTRYLPSQAWASSFIGHDDNFGSNFCVPRLYIDEDKADYVVELLRDGCVYSGDTAEAVAVDFLYSILPQISNRDLLWLRRLIDHVLEQKVVLRAICLSAKEYIRHWRYSRDWQANVENRDLCSAIHPLLPKQLWVVEVSVPELFSANLHKVGEIILDATQQPTIERDFRLFVCARVPGNLVVLQDVSATGVPSFFCVPSQLQSHTPLFGCKRQRSGDK
ncbi:MAG: hypothetical protein JW902_09725 [Syntrophaceae bacterium]|nr:hypothetical protein [Syntrophaceae bacterium]